FLDLADRFALGRARGFAVPLPFAFVPPLLLGSAVAAAAAGAAAVATGAASAATWISTWLVRFLIGVPRPIAAMVKRFSVGPSFTTAYLTRSRSTSSASFCRCALCSAFATADFSTLWICFAASFLENRRIAYASGTGRP